ncbi:hypothetical protein F5879DRAFT_973484 [Lentinula edodes]|nr:hypothetical protein F5879DRAFT_973484 [Lentinula edodes]
MDIDDLIPRCESSLLPYNFPFRNIFIYRQVCSGYVSWLISCILVSPTSFQYRPITLFFHYLTHFIPICLWTEPCIYLSTTQGTKLMKIWIESRKCVSHHTCR